MDLTNSVVNATHPITLETLPENGWAILPIRPILAEVLEAITPLPMGALFLGQAEDGLPVLLNLSDPAPGPLLVVGGTGAGKTDLLRLVAQFVISMHTPREVQFSVVTSRVDEWQERLTHAPHCVGVFSSREPAARQLFQSLEMWVCKTDGNHQPVLLLIDGLEELLTWNESTLVCLHRILVDGPGRRVWPIVTMESHNDTCLTEWFKLFRTRIVAYELAPVEKDRSCLQDGGHASESSRYAWFFLIKNGKRINFWIPELGF